MAKITKKSKVNDMKVFNSLNASQREKNYRVFNQPSQTIPDQTMSIKEILERYAKGLPIGGGLEPIYEEEDTLGINPKTLDLVDIQMIKEKNQKDLAYLKDKFEKENNYKKNSEKTVRPEEGEKP
jgi:hypothetical protein